MDENPYEAPQEGPTSEVAATGSEGLFHGILIVLGPIVAVVASVAFLLGYRLAGIGVALACLGCVAVLPVENRRKWKGIFSLLIALSILAIAALAVVRVLD